MANSKKLRFAGIGCAHMGWKDVSTIGQHKQVEMVAFCDIDSRHFKQVDKQWPGRPKFDDYRVMLEKMGSEIDAVNVTVPDHSHAIIAKAAMELGLHVYCQKPLTHTVWEAREIANVAKQKGVTTRMGNQIHSEFQYRCTKQLIQEEKKIGKVKEIHTWISAMGHGRSGLLDRPEKPGKPPAEVNWDQWIGPAPWREYGADRVYHPFTWRDWQDFGSGSIGDNGCHLLDPLYTALDLKAPLSLVSEHSGMNDEIWPAQETITYTFPGTEYTENDTLKITWYDGGRRPKWKLKGVPAGKDLLQPASLIIGTEGYLLVPHWGTPKLYPEEDFAGYQLPDPGPAHHWHDWVDACLKNDTTLSDDFSYAGPLTEAVQLGNVAAHFPNQSLQWDAEKLAITNLPEANPYLTKQYRKGWEL